MEPLASDRQVNEYLSAFSGRGLVERAIHECSAEIRPAESPGSLTTATIKTLLELVPGDQLVFRNVFGAYLVKDVTRGTGTETNILLRNRYDDIPRGTLDVGNTTITLKFNRETRPTPIKLNVGDITITPNASLPDTRTKGHARALQEGRRMKSHDMVHDLIQKTGSNDIPIDNFNQSTLREYIKFLFTAERHEESLRIAEHIQLHCTYNDSNGYLLERCIAQITKQLEMGRNSSGGLK